MQTEKVTSIAFDKIRGPNGIVMTTHIEDPGGMLGKLIHEALCSIAGLNNVVSVNMITNVEPATNTGFNVSYSIQVATSDLTDRTSTEIERHIAKCIPAERLSQQEPTARIIMPIEIINMPSGAEFEFDVLASNENSLAHFFLVLATMQRLGYINQFKSMLNQILDGEYYLVFKINLAPNVSPTFFHSEIRRLIQTTAGEN